MSSFAPLGFQYDRMQLSISVLYRLKHDQDTKASKQSNDNQKMMVLMSIFILAASLFDIDNRVSNTNVTLYVSRLFVARAGVNR